MEKYHFQYCPKLVVLSADHTAVLLCKRKGERDYDGTFSFIGGKMEISDASIVEGMQREKNEEVGENFKVTLYPTFTSNVLFRKKDGNVMVVPHVLAVHKEGEVTLNDDEYSEYAWVKLDELESFEPKIQNITEMTQKCLRLLEITSEEDLVEI